MIDDQDAAVEQLASYLEGAGCPICDGTGRRTRYLCDEIDVVAAADLGPCPRCGGEGRIAAREMPVLRVIEGGRSDANVEAVQRALFRDYGGG